jgi:hypothetical protein|tara:strand:+ start:4200 stop:5039 length:840 start_codon:yes stop_codon:yes gene_type:complete
MIEILFPTIERWHCIDSVLDNMGRADIPEDIQILTAITAGDEYAEYVTKRLNNIFPKVRMIRMEGDGIDHDKLREEYYEKDEKPKHRDIRQKKLEKVYKTYNTLVEAADPDADFYWFMEDDTLFPLDTYNRYRKAMEYIDADIITGISYYWHTMENHDRNFWNMECTRVFGDRDTSDETTFKLTMMRPQEKGLVQLGASGLGNVFCKAHTVRSWAPKMYQNIGSGADISFFFNAYKNGYKAFGMWDLYLPHITKYSGGDIEIRGRIDKSLIPLLTSHAE